MFDDKLIIKQFLDHPKKEMSSILNAANLTLVLRSLGFFLHEFDLSSSGGDPDDKNLSIEIKCAHSGLVSKLYLPHHECHCQGTHKPENKAYWEVHGNQPNSPSVNKSLPGGSTIVHEAATNLLPEADPTWKILSKNMFNFMIRMQNDIAKYKDDQNNLQYGETVAAVEISAAVDSANPADAVEPSVVVDPISIKTEYTSVFNEASSPVSPQINPNTPFSTPLSSINVTPVVSANGPDLIISAPSDNGESTSSSYHEESMVIALVTEAKAKLDQALLRLKFASLSTEDLFNAGESLKITPNPNGAGNMNTKSVVRRRSTNSSISSTGFIKTEIPTGKMVPRNVGRLSAGADLQKLQPEKKVKSPPKRNTKLFIIPQTRTSALRNNLKSKN